MKTFEALRTINLAAKQYKDKSTKLYDLKSRALWRLKIDEAKYLTTSLHMRINTKNEIELFLYYKFDSPFEKPYGFHEPLHFEYFNPPLTISSIGILHDNRNSKKEFISLEKLNEAIICIQKYIKDYDEKENEKKALLFQELLSNETMLY